MDPYNSNEIIASSSTLTQSGIVNYGYIGFEDFLEPTAVPLENGIDLTKSLNNNVITPQVNQHISNLGQNQPLPLSSAGVQQPVKIQTKNSNSSSTITHLKNDSKPSSSSRPSKKTVCPQCGKCIISRSGNLALHLRTHTGEKPFSCSECGASFASKSYLRIHTRLHTGEKPYMCALCGKKFSQISGLSIHMRIHTGEKPFQCGKCERKFSTKNAYENHVKLHTGDLAFKCEICFKGFVNNSALRDHSKVHSLSKPYECDICGKKFKDKSYVTKHKTKFCGNDGYKKRWKVPGVKKPRGRPPKQGKQKSNRKNNSVKYPVGRPRRVKMQKYKGKARIRLLKKMAEEAKEDADSVTKNSSSTSLENEINGRVVPSTSSILSQAFSKNSELNPKTNLFYDNDLEPIYLGSGNNPPNCPTDQVRVTETFMNNVQTLVQEKCSESFGKKDIQRSKTCISVSLPSGMEKSISKTDSGTFVQNAEIPLYMGNENSSISCSEIPIDIGVQVNHVHHQTHSVASSSYKSSDVQNFTLDLGLTSEDSILNLAQPENLSLHNFNSTQNIDCNLQPNHIFSSFSHQRSPQNLSHSNHSAIDMKFSPYQSFTYSQHTSSGHNLCIRRSCEPQNLSQADQNDDFCSIFSQPENLSLHPDISHPNLGQHQILTPQTNILNLTTIQPENLSLPQNLTVAQNMTEPQNLSLPQNLSQPQNLSLSQSIPTPINFSQAQDVLQPQNLSRSMNLIQPYNLSQPHNLSQPQNLSLVPQSVSHTSSNNSSYNSQPQNLSLVPQVISQNSKVASSLQPQNLSFDSVERSLISLPQTFSEPQNLSISHNTSESSVNFAQPQNLSLSHLSMPFSDHLSQMSENAQALQMVYYP